MKKDEKQLGPAAVECNISYWQAKYTKALEDARLAAEELSKIYDKKAKDEKDKQ